jgi:phosphoribosylaminoimidazolecarboxamide formyltransferase/IMP cyclohydrolase
VKTLDFKIYLGILTETYNDFHKKDLERTNALPIDMVVVNLYPFEETVAKTDSTPENARANIDIGGPCMIRASAKNYLRVASVVSPKDYGNIIEKMEKQGGGLDLQSRFELAKKAFRHTAQYDGAIASYLEKISYPKEVEPCYNKEN